MKLTRSQNKAVEQLFDTFLNRYDQNKHSKVAYFKSPTGSGKTFMSSELISRVFSYNSARNVKTVVVIATISSANLPLQFSKKLVEYKKYHDFSDYSIEYISSPSNSKNNKSKYVKEFFPEDKKVFVFGVSSFGKNALFTIHNTLDNFLTSARNENYKIIFIRDEAHIGAKEKIGKDELNKFDRKMEEAADFVIKMTATPKTIYNLVELTKEELENDNQYLLKTKEIKEELDGEKSDAEIIDAAILQFKETQGQYKNLGDDSIIIRPAMLIQIDNDSEKNEAKKMLFKEGLELLEKKLNENDLTYLKYLDSCPQVVGTNCPNTLEYASRNDSLIDVVIFKVGPATGWDIPRANMLLQLRSVSSEALNMQTLGRIMRNPYPNLVRNDITDKYYLYSNYQKPTRDIASYKLRTSFWNQKLYIGKIKENLRNPSQNNSKYVDEVKKYLKSIEFTNCVEDFKNKQLVYDKTNILGAENVHKIPNYFYLKAYNFEKREEYEENLKVSFFYNDLFEISNKYNLDFEKVKFVFYSQIAEIKRIFNYSNDWTDNVNSYEFHNDGELMRYYSIWIDNGPKNRKQVDFKDFNNYGYKHIKKGEEKIQYLDSGPELECFKDIKDFFKKSNNKRLDDIKFFAKMPTLGSKIYFEYFSKINNSISKSYMDYVLLFDEKLIMIEVKSYDADYNPEKTDELEKAYMQYMKKHREMIEKNKWNDEDIDEIHLIIYKYDKTNDRKHISYFDVKTGEWKNNGSFFGVFSKLF